MKPKALGRLWPALLLMVPALGMAGDLQPVPLPAPQRHGGIPLMEALSARHSSREFSPRPLPPQVLSNLLWAAFGINRPGSGGRTAPSAHNWQEITVFLATADGLYRYDPHNNRMEPVLDRDIRALTGTQDFVAGAPLDLIYVADLDAMKGAGDQDRLLYSSADTGFIAQNVYLYCASAGLNVVVRGSIDRRALAKAMGLGQGQRVVLSQTVGFPKP